MAKRALQLDEIGNWSEIKLEIVERYAGAYSRILASQTFSKGHLYIDAFAGAGTHLSKTRGGQIAGSPVNAMQITPPFQWGGVFKKRTGRELNGRTWDEMPRTLPLKVNGV